MRRLIIISFILLVCASSHAAETSAPLRIEYESRDNISDGVKRDLRALLESAHKTIAPAKGHYRERPIRVEWAPTPEDFQRRISMNAEHIIAAAVPSQGRMIFNADTYNRADAAQQQITVTHEYVHLFFGLYCSTPLPRWLDEGLAMRLSNDYEFASDFRLTFAHSTGRLIPLGDLIDEYPDDPDTRSLAYNESFSVTGYLIKEKYPVSGARGFVEELIDPALGSSLIASMRDERKTALLNKEWSESLGSFWSWISVFANPDVIWSLSAAVFVLAGFWAWRRRQLHAYGETESKDWRSSLNEDWRYAAQTKAEEEGVYKEEDNDSDDEYEILNDDDDFGDEEGVEEWDEDAGKWRPVR